jgi:hypothetical protein
MLKLFRKYREGIDIQPLPLLHRIFGNSFRITSEPSGAKVTYIVDPYDPSTNIECTTPCTIHLPWEPLRHQHHKDKIRITKEGYTPQVAHFKYGIKTWLKIDLFFVALLVYYFVSIYPESLLGVAVFVLLYSIGSDDMHVVLKKEHETRDSNPA